MAIKVQVEDIGMERRIPKGTVVVFNDSLDEQLKVERLLSVADKMEMEEVVELVRKHGGEI